MARAIPRRRRLARAIVPIMALVLAGLAMASAVDRAIDERDLDGSALSELYGAAGPASEARVDLARGQTAAAREHALLAARRDPVGRGNVALVGSIELLLGHSDQAAPLFAAATLAGWRDPATQLWAMNQAFTLNDPVNAARRIDALARTGTPMRMLDPFLSALEAMRGGRAALLQRLGEHPQWAADFVAHAGATAPGNLAARVETLVAVSRAGLMPPPPALENAEWSVLGVDPALAWSLHARTARSAYAVPGFAAPHLDQARQAGSPFVWRLVNPQDYALVRRAGSLRFSPTGSGPVDAAQLAAALPPGGYRYRWNASASTRVAPLMQMSCPRKPGEAGVIGRLPPGEGNFVVPADCPGQILQLTLSGGVADRTFEIGDFTVMPAR